MKETSQSFGFNPAQYNQIVIFDNEDDFKKIVAANPPMKAIMGGDDYTREHFPGVFMAGVKSASSREDI